MNRSVLIRTVAASFILMFLIVSTSRAQEQRRLRPAFPIGAGEKMLVIPGLVFVAGESPGTQGWVKGNVTDVFSYKIILPVGTVLKRMVVEASDYDGTDATYMNFKLERLRNSAPGIITLREVTTLGYDSTAFTQLISNPMNHAMLQGWTYYVHLTFPGGGSLSHKIGVIKIIYEP